MDFKEVMENARKCLGKCKGCPVCNGVACRNTIPGPGAKGVGDTAIRNYAKWQEVRVVMDTLCEKRPVDTSIELFGRSFKYPIFAGPVGAVAMHYSDKYNDVTYNAELVPGCAEAGIAAFTGDGMDPMVMQGATDAIKACGGVGVPTVKPWNAQMIAEKMELVKKSGAFAVAMDVDAAGLPFLKNFVPPAGSKSVEEMKAIIKDAGLPFIIKGIMSVKGALKAREAGAAAIVVSRSSWMGASAAGWMYSKPWPWGPMRCSSPVLSSMRSMGAAKKALGSWQPNWGLSWQTPWKCAGPLLSKKSPGKWSGNKVEGS